MFGSIMGDICGSRFERRNTHQLVDLFDLSGCRATDDTILTLATLGHLTKAAPATGDYAESLRIFYRLTPMAGYGSRFHDWAQGMGPNDSFGNGAAMRISPVAFLFPLDTDLDHLLELTRKLTIVSHDHPDAVKGAQSVVEATVSFRRGEKVEDVKGGVEKKYGYDLNIDPNEVRHRKFDATCTGSVPQAIWAGMTAGSFFESIRLAISLGGDSDTIACIAGTIAEARFGVDRKLAEACLNVGLKTMPAELHPLLMAAFEISTT